LSRHRPLTIAVGKCLATLRTARRIWAQGEEVISQRQVMKRDEWRRGSRHRYRVRHVGGVGVVDDGGERSVVVEEDDDLLALGRRHHLVELAQRRRVLHLPIETKQRSAVQHRQ
jgi:hypothetical protein